MEFAKDKEFVADFVLRTKQNIERGCHPHEITQLINSLVGLLILPKERYYDNIHNKMVDRWLLNKLRQCVEIPSKSYSTELKYIVRRMRNSLAHFHIDCMVDKNTRQVDHIVFKDYDDGKEKDTPDFQIKIHHSILEQFVFQFSKAVSNSISQENDAKG